MPGQQVTYTQDEIRRWLHTLVETQVPPVPKGAIPWAALAEFDRLRDVEREYRDFVDTLEVGS